MFLNEILNNIPVIQVVGPPDLVDVEDITIDSRNVKNKTLFVAIKGYKTDGHKFIPQAISSGASAVILEEDNHEISSMLRANNVAKILVKNSRKTLAKVSVTFFNSPSTKLNLIGITGTKGKTTTSYFIKSILDYDSRRTGLIGTNKNMIKNEEIVTKLTTPESHVINELLDKMVKANCTDCVMEVSSHSLMLSRVDNLDFNVGVFTNITSDHLDFHSTFENYIDAKKILFDNLNSDSTALFNLDDKNSNYLMKNCTANKVSYGMDSNSDLVIQNVQYDLDGTNFTINHNGIEHFINTKLIGMFNAYNSTAAIGAALLSGIDFNRAVEGTSITEQVPGRFEVLGENQKKVIIDYSHTADSLQKALDAIKHITSAKRPIFTVFGCGGDRDKSKRPEMGTIASSMSDYAIITSDNPRSENPMNIIKDIEDGMKNKNYEILEDRDKAIKSAIENSPDDAVILIAGKGHEEYQEINGVRHFFSDKVVAQKYL